MKKFLGTFAAVATGFANHAEAAINANHAVDSMEPSISTEALNQNAAQFSRVIEQAPSGEWNSFVLRRSSDNGKVLAWHESHASHESHQSHESHSSHYSSRY